MPIITVDMFDGRSVDEKRALAEELTAAMSRVTGLRPEAIQVILRDVPRENWAVAGHLYSDPS